MVFWYTSITTDEYEAAQDDINFYKEKVDKIQSQIDNLDNELEDADKLIIRLERLQRIIKALKYFYSI